MHAAVASISKLLSTSLGISLSSPSYIEEDEELSMKFLMVAFGQRFPSLGAVEQRASSPKVLYGSGSTNVSSSSSNNDDNNVSSSTNNDANLAGRFCHFWGSMILVVVLY